MNFVRNRFLLLEFKIGVEVALMAVEIGVLLSVGGPDRPWLRASSMCGADG